MDTDMDTDTGICKQVNKQKEIKKKTKQTALKVLLRPQAALHPGIEVCKAKYGQQPVSNSWVDVICDCGPGAVY